MSNLFVGWPKTNLAVATYRIDISETNLCNTYYQLGIEEDYRPWIFSFFRNKKKSGLVNVDEIKAVREKSKETRRLLSTIYLNLNSLTGKALKLLGIYYWAYQLRLSNSFIQWFDNYNPEFIYAQVSSYQLVHFLSELYKIRKVPFALHFMDDHINTMVDRNLFYFYWKNRIVKEFSALIENAAVLMSICDAMSIEYEKRFNRKFHAFHNPVDLNLWLKNSKSNCDVELPFKILYAGRVGLGTDQALVDISEAVENLWSQGLQIEFYIQVNCDANGVLKKFEKYSRTFIHESVDYNLLPSKISEADLLVMPIDFQKRGYRYLKYSMPTKTSEYMISGIPILIYSPSATALAEYARNYNWAYLVTERNPNLLAKAIHELYVNYKLRESISQNAKKLAIEKHNSAEIRKQFSELINEQRK